jgi:hypothetical protein
VDADRRTLLLDRYRRGPALVAAALDGLTDEDLDARPSPGEWSAREVVHHLADSETTSGIRLRRLVVEDEPFIPAYDEAEWARRLHYDRPIETSLALFTAVRAATASLLDALADADFERAGTHEESGPYGVATWLEIYASHAEEHAEQIRKAAASAP